MKLIKEIGSNLNKEWKKIDYKNSIFPKLSTDLLEKYKERILRSNLDNYFNALFDKDVPIGNSYFGDCSITLFRTPKFYIEVIFWNSSWTSIHEHGFCGAFLNLQGERLVGYYTYEVKKQIENNFLKGVLKKEKSDYMKEGEVRTIVKGLEGIHRTICVEGLGISLVIRTLEESPTQLHFFHNGMAICSWNKPKDKIKKVCTFLQMLRRKHFSAMMESTFDQLTLYELTHFLMDYQSNYRITDTEYSLIQSLLLKMEYGNEIKEILKEEKTEKNIRKKIFNTSPYDYDMRKELAFMAI